MLQNAHLLAKIGADTAENKQRLAELVFSVELGAAPRLPRRLVPPPEKTENDLLATKPTGPWRWVRVRKISKIGKISKILQIFGGLVLGCIKTKFCKKICI